MEDSLIDELHACRTLLRIHRDAAYWFSDFAELVSQQTNRELVDLDAKWAVVTASTKR